MLPDGIGGAPDRVSRYYTPSGRCIQKSYEDGLEAYQREKRERLEQRRTDQRGQHPPSDTVRYLHHEQARGLWRWRHHAGRLRPHRYDAELGLLRPAGAQGRPQHLRPRTMWMSTATTCCSAFQTWTHFRDDFTVDDAMLEALEAQAVKDGVAPDPDGLERSRPLIDLRLKALIARDLWDTSAYWQVINADNPVDRSFQKALEALGDDTFQRLGMLER